MAPQGEKSSVMNNDLGRKASYESAQKMDKKVDCWGSKSSSNNNNNYNNNSNNNGQQQKNQQHGSWGPMFKNKSNFAEMHWC